MWSSKIANFCLFLCVIQPHLISGYYKTSYSPPFKVVRARGVSEDGEKGEVTKESPPSLPFITIRQGKLVGTYEESRDGRIYSSFKGIPYASVGQRFEDPSPPRPWKEKVLNASTFGPRCVQFQGGAVLLGEEDCLFLNVFVPKESTESLLPVMVYFEAGAFQGGGADLSGPDYFMDEKIILVTFNYRLNIFGFLSTNDHIVSGNMGLKDQHFALVWVHYNIAAFGGDPSAVTIFGESAGGSAALFQLLAPASRGLFRSAISQSASPLIYRHFTENLAPATEAFAERVGCSSKRGTRAMVACLRRKGANELVQGLSQTGNALEMAISIQTFGPTLEKPGGFISSTPIQSLRSGSFAKVPLILTINKDEGLLRNSALVIQSPELIALLNNDWYNMAPITFGNYGKFAISPSTRTFIASRIREFYFNNGEVGIDSFENLTAVYSDAWFMSGIKRFATLYAKEAPVYAGVFAYEGIWSSIFMLGYTQPLGVAHSDDLQYLFNSDLYPKFMPGSRLENISKRFVKSWVKFATVGVPDSLQINYPKQRWPALTRKEIQSGSINWIYFQDIPQRSLEPLRSRLKFWDFINMVIEFDLKFQS